MTQLTLEQAARNPDRLASIRRRRTHCAQTVTINERFEAFHAAHPEVYQLLVRLARQVKARGKSGYGMKALFEQARWFYHIEQGNAEFKLNNVFTSRYSRLIEENEPDLRGFFNKRELRSE